MNLNYWNRGPRLRGLLLTLALVLMPLFGLVPAASAQGPTPGTVMGWGDDFFGQVSGRPTDAGYTAIAAGDHYSLALRSDGTVVAWGADGYGQVSGRPTDAGYIAIAAGRDFGLALRSDGTVVAWGRNQYGQVSGRPTDAGYIAIEGGIAHSLALRSDGTVVAWGNDEVGQVSGRPTDANYTAIAAGRDTNLALRSDGTVVAWGRDDDGEVSGRPTDAGYIAVAAGYADNLALRSDGTVVTWGRNSDGSQTVPPGLSHVVAIARGNDHSLVLVGELDTTPPVIAPDVSGTLNNGWYTSDVQLSWNVSDEESAIASTSGCDPQSVTTDTSGLTFTCSATSSGGTNSQSVTIKRDATAPTTTATPDRTPDNNSWYNKAVTFSFNGNDGSGSGVTSCDAPKSYSGPDSASASVTGNCTDAAGNVGSASASFLYDATTPSVSYTGNAGTYTIDQNVSITCSASDNLSKIASSTCANISGPAYSFALGTNTRTATATDNAGNTGSGSTTFTVGVTFDSLCTLSASFSTDPAVDQGLCDKLALAKAAAASGDTKTKNNNLNAYRLQVTAQSGKALTKQQATILSNLSKAL